MIEEGEVLEPAEERPITVATRERFARTTDEDFHETKKVVRSYNFIWFLVGIVEFLMVFRFLFEVLGANPVNSFVAFIYALSYPFAAPFHSIFSVTVVANSFFDWSLIVGIVVYYIIGYGLVQLLSIIHPVTTENTRHRIRTI